MSRHPFLLALLILLGGCASDMSGPSLAARPAEAIDPRLPVGSTEPPPGPLTVATDVVSLRARLNDGAAAFDRQLAPTRQRVAAAGGRASESWVQAQETLSLLERAHRGVSVTLADLDALVTDRIERDGWASPNDRDAAQALLVEARARDAFQRAEIAALSARLAR